MRTTATVIIVAIAAAGVLLAQPASIGVRGGYLNVQNTSTIPVLIGSRDADCGRFTDGNSGGIYAGVTGDYAILGDALELGIGLSFFQRPARLTTQTQAGFEVLDPITNSYVPLVQEHAFESTLGYVSFEFNVRTRPLPDVPIYIKASFDAGNPLVSSSFSQTEQIVAPDAVLYPEGTKIRTAASGEFPGLGTSMGVGGGLGAVFNVSNDVEFGPEIFYRYGLNSLTSSTTWNQSWIGAGITLRYRMFESEPPPPPPPPPPAPEPAPIVEAPAPEPEPSPLVIASLTTVPLEIRETVVTQTFPLLPYLFFDSASVDLPAKYRFSDAQSSFNERALAKETLPIYYRILDIIGSRMRQGAQSKLTITGTTDGEEGATQEARQAIAEGRAQSAASYLSNRWGIGKDRLVIRTSAKPSNPSRQTYVEGGAENRRVELASADDALLGPIVHTRFNEYVAVQAKHDFSTHVRNPERAERWNLNVTHHGTQVASRSGKLMPPETMTFNLNSEMTKQLGPVIGSVDTLRALLSIDQVGHDPASAEVEFPLRKTVSNFEVSRLSLIVFDYDRSDISDQNKEMMRKVVTASTREGSTAKIIGTTDKLGELEHNMELSQERANSVENFVRSIAPSLTIQEVKGVGPEMLPYDNTLPEGRFYCRTVSLQITTPVRVR